MSWTTSPPMLRPAKTTSGTTTDWCVTSATSGSLDENSDARTGGVIDNRRWYEYRSNANNFDALEEGYDHFGSPKLLPDAAEEITGQRSGRVLYALTIYSSVIHSE